VRTFQRKLLCLFRRHYDGWRFFHDSFRQFAADRTALGDDGHVDARQDALAHGRVAELCAETDDPGVAAELRGSTRPGAALGSAGDVRDQYRRLRSPDLIRGDVALALGMAGDHTVVLAMLRLLLALVEVNERTSNLESVDMLGLLCDAGLID
jgi:hypothetical protein